ncbi:MAG TPA: PspC domain-containing protein [Blastococcus sp.]|nr:PspC domain-containing protein [Blastococcus sp.]
MNDHATLSRSETDRMIAGVCGGVAAAVGVNSTLIRVLWVGLTLLGAVGLLLYLILWIAVPTESRRHDPRGQIARQGLAEIREQFEALGGR